MIEILRYKGIIPIMIQSLMLINTTAMN